MLQSRAARRWMAVLVVALPAVVLLAVAALAEPVTVAGITFHEGATPVSAIVTATPGWTHGTLTLTQAEAKYDFDLPTTVPTGYSLDNETVYEADSGEGYVLLTFVYEASAPTDADSIRLDIEINGDLSEWDAPADSVEEVTINGEAAASWNGVWDDSSEDWGNSHTYHLSWQQGDDHYHFSGPDQDDLVDMAESMPHFS